MAQTGTQADESSLEMHTDTLSPGTAISAESTFLFGSLSAGSKSAEKISSPFVAVVCAAAAVSSVLQENIKIKNFNTKFSTAPGFDLVHVAYLDTRQLSRGVATMHPLQRQHTAIADDGGVSECKCLSAFAG